MNIEQAYEKVNAVLTADVPVSTLTLSEAQKAVRKMYRHLQGKKFPYRIVETSGNRYTWLYGVSFRVNCGRGWKDLIHLFSHWYHRTVVGGRPHSKKHARLEKNLLKWAFKHGWFGGALKKPEKQLCQESPQQDRARLIELRRAQVARLERKIKCLTTRMQKAKRSLAALERFSKKGDEHGQGS
jgi:hypothetical protein